MDSIRSQRKHLLHIDFPKLPLQWRSIAILCAIFVYAFGYLVPGQVDFTRRALFDFIPVVLAALYYGSRAGLLVSTVILAFNLSAFYIQEGPNFGEFISRGGLSSYFALVSAGFLVGYLSDLKKRLEHELSRRERAEAVAKASQESWHTYIQQASDLIFTIDATGRVSSANPAVCETLGYTPDEVIGLDPFELVSPSDQESARSALEAIINGKTVDWLELEATTKDGRQIILEIRGRAIFEKGQFARTLHIARDVTGRKKMEQSEREQYLLAEALRDINAALNSTLRFDEVLDRILTNVGRVIQHDSGTIMLVEDGVARIARCKGYTERGGDIDVLGTQFVVVETPNLDRMTKTGKPIFISDTYTDAGWIQRPETAWLRSYVGAPIQVKGETIGFLNLDSDEPGFFTQNHAQRLQTIGDQAGVAIENARLFEEVQRFARQMTLLNDITRIGISAPNVENMLQRLADRLGELFNADGAYLTIWDEERQIAVPAAAYGPARETYTRLKPEPGELTMTASALRENCVLVAEDVFKSPYISSRIARQFPTRSLMALPLAADGRKLGAALIGFNQRRRFTQEDKSLGDQAAAQISLALFKSRVLEAERERASQLTRANSFIMALGRVASRIDQARDPDIVMETMGLELKKLNIHSMVALQLPESKDLVVRYLSLDSKSVQLAEEVVGLRKSDFRITPKHFPYYVKVIDSGQAVFSADPALTLTKALPGLPKSVLEHFATLIQFSEEVKIIFLPLTAEERTFGTLWLWGTDLEEGDLAAASVFASQVAVALENARLYNTTQQMAITDDLTGLLNRRGISEIGPREIERATRFRHPLSIIMMDIDHFKSVNDTHGHTVGDQVLKELSHRLKSNLRGVDMISRYGGEEFVILLPETNLAAALDVAQRLHKQVVENPFLTAVGDVCITISLGVSTLESGQVLEDMIESADRALYSAKDSGRNRVSATIDQC